MRWSRALIPTAKAVPKDAVTASHQLLLRAGYIRMVGAGIYEMLPLGVRVLHKISAIVQQHMDAAGGLQVQLPALLPADYFRESGRWDSFGPALFRLQDRRDADLHLGPTHEEIITDLVRREVHSYKQLPLLLYQIQTKFRDEPRPRAGLLRGREFLMKDAYSFDTSLAAAEDSYARMRDCYRRIFDALGFRYAIVAADSGAMGGSQSAEFQILVQEGEDSILSCSACAYAANVEVAEAARLSRKSPTAVATPAASEVHTPGVGRIEEVLPHLGDGVTAVDVIKALLCDVTSSDGGARQTVMVLVRGDREVNVVKLAQVLGGAAVALASPERVRAESGTRPGFVGPVGFKATLIVDPEVAVMPAAFCGAGRDDFHLRNVVCGRDFQPTQVVDVRLVEDGDPCPRCGHALQRFRSIEGGHIFVLGTHYSDKMGARFADDQGKEQPVVMGCYGIGISRLMAAAVEQHHDADGICWPEAIAPYRVLLLSLGREDAVHTAANALYEALQAAGIDCLWDDRPERPGAKFKDADLIGIPWRITVGARGLAEGKVEVKRRGAPAAERLAPSDVVAWLQAHLLPHCARALIDHNTAI
ncbi:MAG: proline--tRNA ligase [Polyangiales bacterium]